MYPNRLPKGPSEWQRSPLVDLSDEDDAGGPTRYTIMRPSQDVRVHTPDKRFVDVALASCQGDCIVGNAKGADKVLFRSSGSDAPP